MTNDMEGIDRGVSRLTSHRVAETEERGGGVSESWGHHMTIDIEE